jgi:hypothetical protein
VKLVAVPSLTPEQAAFRLDTGELVLAEVVVETVGAGDGRVLRLRGWRINEDGSRYTDERGGVEMIPAKIRFLNADDDLDNEKADAMVAIANRLAQHIEALKAVRPNPDEDNDRSL